MDRQKIERSIKGLSEWQMHVQAESDIDTNISTAIEALKAQLSQEGTTSDTIQPKVIIGHWIQYDKRFPWRHHYKCSVCGNYLDFSGVNGGRGEANFCPNCGAKMKGAKHEAN